MAKFKPNKDVIKKGVSTAKAANTARPPLLGSPRQSVLQKYINKQRTSTLPTVPTNKIKAIAGRSTAGGAGQPGGNAVVPTDTGTYDTTATPLATGPEPNYDDLNTYLTPELQAELNAYKLAYDNWVLENGGVAKDPNDPTGKKYIYTGKETARNYLSKQSDYDTSKENLKTANIRALDAITEDFQNRGMLVSSAFTSARDKQNEFTDKQAQELLKNWNDVQADMLSEAVANQQEYDSTVAAARMKALNMRREAMGLGALGLVSG